MDASYVTRHSAPTLGWLLFGQQQPSPPLFANIHRTLAAWSSTVLKHCTMPWPQKGRATLPSRIKAFEKTLQFCPLVASSGTTLLDFN